MEEKCTKPQWIRFGTVLTTLAIRCTVSMRNLNGTAMARPRSVPVQDYNKNFIKVQFNRKTFEDIFKYKLTFTSYGKELRNLRYFFGVIERAVKE
ncbi:hypothetical protein TNIN_429691 [Trichonephila inaurata madagascariensis]|uniref:Uncharacterized protein n=1 Tax=Trichonephila inaurata madagascariensis TaxID=2747483 RepID=A0A8X7CUW3_9ARAC|nr:hypothetical protein TNIN_429691 [Trichonephila inaurata madagascariensis]